MLVFGTQMHLVTFIFVNIEIVIFFYLIIYKLARPGDKTTLLNIVLIFLLITYNITGGLLPDPNLPGTFFIQEIIAYGTGFITPCYFPYYVYKAFKLEKMKTHAYKGVVLLLILPYLIFVIVFTISNDLETAKKILIIPVLYALCVIFSILKAIKFKYGNKFNNKESREEIVVLIFSLTPWIGLPVIAYFDLSQAVEASVTNTGFLLLFSLQVSRHIKLTRIEQERLINSELRLSNWNITLQREVDKRTMELKKANEEKTNTFINLVHETKTPLTLMNNYLDEYINKYGSVEELDIIKNGINKLTKDVSGLFDIERFNKGFEVYNHRQISNFSEILKNSFVLFEYYCSKKNIECHTEIEENIFIKSDPNALDRIVNNLIENAIKFSNTGGNIKIILKSVDDKINFTIQDTGIGIPAELQKNIFKPYFQINHKKTGNQGMGLGLPIVKKVVESLGGWIQVSSHAGEFSGTEINIVLNRYDRKDNEDIIAKPTGMQAHKYNFDVLEITDSLYRASRQTILLVEDQKSMLKFLFNKLSVTYNVFCSLNGAEALKKLQELPVIPDLILSDIMMDTMDGFAFAKAISGQDAYNHIPIIFLSAKSTSTDKLKGLRLGAIDLIQKPFSFEILIQKIDAILKNINKQKKAVLNTSIANLKALDDLDIIQPNAEPGFEQTCKLYNLTSREIEIVQLILKGSTYKTIAKNLYIAGRTVTKHVENIFRKVEVSNKVELINKLHTKLW